MRWPGRSGRLCLRSIPLLSLLGGGGEVADAYPLVVVESDTARASGLQLVRSDTARVSVLPVADCKFPAVFLGKVALGCGRSRRCPAVSPRKTLLTLTNERAHLARAAPGVTPVDISEKGAPVRELIRPSVLGEPQVVNLQEPTPVEKRLEYAIPGDSFSMGAIRTGALCCVRRRGL